MIGYGRLEDQDLRWIVRRLPPVVRRRMEAGPATSRSRIFLAGGFIRSCVAGEPVNDVDLFTASREDGFDLALDLTREKSGVKVPASGSSRWVRTGTGWKRKPYTTKNAYTVRGKPPLQVIHRWTFTDPAELLESFDFTIARAVVWCDVLPPMPGEPAAKSGPVWNSMTSPSFYADLAAKRLRYCSPRREEEAGGSLLRVLRFYQRGYRIPIDSLGAVLARLAVKLHFDGEPDEESVAQVLTGLLREVDPAVDPAHVAHLPAEDAGPGGPRPR